MTTARPQSAPEGAVEGLAPLLRVLGAKERLRILATLSHEERSAPELAEALGIPRPVLYRHLRVLQRAGLVRARRGDRRKATFYHCDGGRLTEMNSGYLALLGLAMVAGGAPRQGAGDLALTVVGPPPAVCTYCQNSSYVYGVLEEMNRTLAEAREAQEQLRRLSSLSLSAQEEERKRIARDLHDDTAQSLTSLLVRLRLLERMGDPGKAREGLLELRELAAETLEGVRRLALDLRPSALDDLGLAAALRWYVSEFTQRWGIEVELEIVGLDGRLPAEVELVLYRVAQEALTNVAKHAQASRVKVTLEQRGRRVRLVLADDGCGFDVEAALRSKERGLGLFGMEERLSLVGGKVSIQSQPGHGTRVEAEVTLKGRDLLDVMNGMP